MANFNRIILIGRLTRDVEVRTFSNGGKVAKFGFATEQSRKKNPQTGQWEGEPCFVDVEVFNRGENGTLANTVEQYCRKGSLICVEGKLHLEQWDDKTSGQKRSKHKVVADAIQLLESKAEAGSRGGQQQAPQGAGRANPSYAPSANDGPPDDGGDSIPF